MAERLQCFERLDFDLIGSGSRDLSPALRDAINSDYEVAVKFFGAHAEPTLVYNADRLMRIFPGDFVPRLMVTTVNICVSASPSLSLPVG